MQAAIRHMALLNNDDAESGPCFCTHLPGECNVPSRSSRHQVGDAERARDRRVDPVCTHDTAVSLTESARRASTLQPAGAPGAHARARGSWSKAADTGLVLRRQLEPVSITWVEEMNITLLWSGRLFLHHMDERSPVYQLRDVSAGPIDSHLKGGWCLRATGTLQYMIEMGMRSEGKSSKGWHPYARQSESPRRAGMTIFYTSKPSELQPATFNVVTAGPGLATIVRLIWPAPPASKHGVQRGHGSIGTCRSCQRASPANILGPKHESPQGMGRWPRKYSLQRRAVGPETASTYVLRCSGSWKLVVGSRLQDCSCRRNHIASRRIGGTCGYRYWKRLQP
jgi:hypothetical protein